jgi:hypothetical protein
MTGETYGQQMDEALACKTKEEATAWLEKEIAGHVGEYQQSPEDARKVILSNIGYMTGYYGQDVADRMFDLFGAVHPIFGLKQPGPEKAFEMGLKLGRRTG